MEEPTFTALLEESMHVDAAPEQVWEVVADPRRMSRWSPTVAWVRLRTEEPVGLGTRTLNVNRKGLLVWTTRSQVVEWVPPRRMAWRIRDNRAVWSFELEPADGGTLVVHRRETPDGIHPAALAREDRFMGGVARFEDTLQEGMRRTLEGVRRDAERRG